MVRSAREVVVGCPVGPVAANRIGARSWGPFRSAGEAVLAGASILALAHMIATMVTGGYTLSLGLARLSGKSVLTPAIVGSISAAGWIWVRSLRAGPSPAGRAAAVFFLCVAAFILNRDVAISGDVVPATYLPLAVVAHGALDLNGFPFLYENGLVHSMTNYGGRVFSSYPLGAPLAALPFYVPAGVGRGVPGGFVLELGKAAAAALAAASAAVFYLLLSRMTSARVSGLATGAYALGTSTLSSSAQMLWQHAPAQLFIVLGMWVLFRADADPRRAWLAGIPFGLAVACRPTNVLVFAVFGVYAVWRHGPGALAYMLGIVPPILLTLGYNFAYYGVWNATIGGYNRGMMEGFVTPFLEGLAGLTVSPGRGLLVYSPVLAFSLAGFVLAWRRRAPLAIAAGLAAGAVLGLHAKWDGWWGGVCFGPRLLSDALPLLSLLLVPALEWIERGGGPRAILRIWFGVLLGISVWIHAMGSCIPNRWDGAHFSHGNLAEDARELWKVKDGPLVTYASDLFRPVPESAAFAGTLVLAAVAFAVLLRGTRSAAPATDVVRIGG